MTGDSNRVKVDKPCTLCGKVPKEGYYPSRAEKHDWVCPKCSYKRKRKYEQQPKEDSSGSSEGNQGMG